MRISTRTYSFLFTCLAALLTFTTFAESCETSATFTASANNLSVSFTDGSSSDCQIVAWNWNLGDGAYSSIQHPTHTYPYASTFHVCLTLTLETAEGQIEEHVTCQEIVVENGLPCALNADFDVITDNDGSVLLTENCTAGFFTSVESLEWSFGDGATDEGEMAAHTYSESGTYEVCLVAHGTTGQSTCQNVQCAEVEVSIVLPVITAAFEIKSADHCRIIPKVSTLSVENVEVVEHRWELSDGRTFYGDQPQIDLLENGSLEICLIEECLSLGQYQEFTSCQLIEVDCVTSQEVQAPIMNASFDEVEKGDGKTVEVKRFADQIQVRSTVSENLQINIYDPSGRLLDQRTVGAHSVMMLPVYQTGAVIIQTISADGLIAVYRTASL